MSRNHVSGFFIRVKVISLMVMAIFNEQGKIE